MLQVSGLPSAGDGSLSAGQPGITSSQDPPSLNTLPQNLPSIPPLQPFPSTSANPNLSINPNSIPGNPYSPPPSLSQSPASPLSFPLSPSQPQQISQPDAANPPPGEFSTSSPWLPPIPFQFPFLNLTPQPPLLSTPFPPNETVTQGSPSSFFHQYGPPNAPNTPIINISIVSPSENTTSLLSDSFNTTNKGGNVNQGLNMPLIIGAAVGGFAGIIILASLVVFGYRRVSQQRRSAKFSGTFCVIQNAAYETVNSGSQSLNHHAFSTTQPSPLTNIRIGPSQIVSDSVPVANVHDNSGLRPFQRPRAPRAVPITKNAETFHDPKKYESILLADHGHDVIEQAVLQFRRQDEIDVISKNLNSKNSSEPRGRVTSNNPARSLKYEGAVKYEQDINLDYSTSACLTAVTTERCRWRLNLSEIAAEIVIMKPDPSQEGGMMTSRAGGKALLLQAIWRDRWPVTLYFHRWSKPVGNYELVQFKSRLDGLAKKRYSVTSRRHTH